MSAKEDVKMLHDRIRLLEEKVMRLETTKKDIDEYNDYEVY